MARVLEYDYIPEISCCEHVYDFEQDKVVYQVTARGAHSGAAWSCQADESKLSCAMDEARLLAGYPGWNPAKAAVAA